MTKSIQIQRDNKSDFKAMYRFMLKQLAREYGSKVDYLFVNGSWPKD